jgi:TRAP-type C4-dicarboxylate transport system permease small subunit
VDADLARFRQISEGGILIKFLVTFDIWARKFLAAFCSIMLLLMVLFTIYTVFMRYVLEQPPAWGDLLTVLANIWLTFIALALTVREREHIALNLIYSRLPVPWAFGVQQFWAVMIFLLGLVICIQGYDAAMNMGGKYWEMWHFQWEDGWFVFKSNYMPKRYAMMILPLGGGLISLGALIAIFEDCVLFKKGKFVVAGGIGSA